VFWIVEMGLNLPAVDTTIRIVVPQTRIVNDES
jgi:hypothetical protein